MSGPSRTSHSGHSGQSVRGTGVDRSLTLTASRVILFCIVLEVIVLQIEKLNYIGIA